AGPRRLRGPRGGGRDLPFRRPLRRPPALRPLPRALRAAVGHAAGARAMSAANERDLQPFSPRTLLALIGVGAVAFLVMAYFMIAGESGRERWPAIPSPTSRSAVGYRAFIELMRHFDLPLGSPSDGELRRASLRIVLAPASPKELHAIEASTS